MFEQFRRSRRSVMSAALLFLILGAALTIRPDLFLKFACYIIGAVLVAVGVIRILEELRQSRKSILSLGLGVVLAAVGIVVITNPALVSSIIPIIFGLILLMDGVYNIRHAIGMHRYQEHTWSVMLILGLITLALGVLILLHPYGTAQLAFRIMGIALLYNAISDLFIYYHVGRAAKKYVDADGVHDIIDVEGRPVEDDDEL